MVIYLGPVGHDNLLAVMEERNSCILPKKKMLLIIVSRTVLDHFKNGQCYVKIIIGGSLIQYGAKLKF